MDTLAITVRAKGLLNRIVTPVTVRQSEAFCLQYGKEIKSVETSAMWDTGSTGCCISQRLADHMGLISIDSWSLTSVHDSKLANVYLLDLVLPDGIAIANVRAVEIITSGQYDVIIGMNIITLGDFSIKNTDSNTVMSFSLPTAANPVDYGQKE